MIEWNKSLETGIEEIDCQHKQLVNMINRLEAACASGIAKNEAGNMMKFLEAYIIIHFQTEELFQQLYGYPNYETHKLQHEEFTKELIRLKTVFDNHGASSFFVVELRKKVSDWFIQHICGTDMVMGSFIKNIIEK